MQIILTFVIRINPMKQAVITGDLIHSSRMNNEDKVFLFETLSNCFKTWNKEFGMKSEIYRGDSFQCLLHHPHDALTVALLIKTLIRSLNPTRVFDIQKRNNPKQKKGWLQTDWIIDARIAIAIGKVDFKTAKLGTSNGSAFQLSGHLLDDIKNTKQHLAIASDDQYNDELETESILLDSIISRTSALQCEVIYYKLLGYTEIEIAKELNIMQSAINQRSMSGSWNAIDTMVARFENIYKK
jgi:hypothetical protein